ncbi:MAG: 50S ribosomal protein L35 [Lactobacillales bacterium]|nr:50S ribosomal protein L35 [Lactobacillales bacterium]
MPKQKTHKGTAKVCKVRPGGTIKIGTPGSRHNTGKKNAAANRKSRKGSLLSNGDYKRLKDLI